MAVVAEELAMHRCCTVGDFVSISISCTHMVYSMIEDACFEDQGVERETVEVESQCWEEGTLRAEALVSGNLMKMLGEIWLRAGVRCDNGRLNVDVLECRYMDACYLGYHFRNFSELLAKAGNN